MRLPPHTHLPSLTLQILLSFDPSPPWNVFSFLVLTLVCSVIISPNVFMNLNIDTGIGYIDYMLGSGIGTCVVDGFDLLLFRRPLKNFKYVGNENGKVHKVWWKRHFDLVCIMSSLRGVGWNYQVRLFKPCYWTGPEHSWFIGEEYPPRSPTTQTLVYHPLYPACCLQRGLL